MSRFAELSGEGNPGAAQEDRKRRLERMLHKSLEGILLNGHLHGDGTAVFAHACKFKDYAEAIAS